LEPVAVIALVIALLVAVVILGLRRRPRQDDGMQTFRRHIDALSPEARREVMDRARRHDQGGQATPNGHAGPFGPAGPAGPAGQVGQIGSTGRGGRDDERGPDAAAAGGAADGNG
jgi:hypothetical protein